MSSFQLRDHTSNVFVSLKRYTWFKLHSKQSCLKTKQAYADPLRTFAKAKDTALLPAYEAKTLFGNIDIVLVTNQSFLYDLERMLAPGGNQVVGGIGDVCLKHVRGIINYYGSDDSLYFISSRTYALLIVTSSIIPKEKRH